MKMIGIVLFVFALISLLTGLYKLNVYTGDGYNTTNAYVGGDAYNYIINGTYFTGHSVLAMGFGIMGTIFFLTATILDRFDDTPDITELKLQSIVKDRQNAIIKDEEEELLSF